jgi:hypothetical protein
MKVRRTWIPVVVLLGLLYLLSQWNRERLCARPPKTGDLAASCGETGGTIVNGQCICPNGVV